MPCCPFCSSDRVYSLLDTLRCKRCKNIWKVGEDEGWSANAGSPAPDHSRMIRKKIDPLEIRMEKMLQHYLTRSPGKFCFATMTWQAGDISRDVFRRYLDRCVKDRSLAEEKDRYGRSWYRRSG